jgi:bla regulator protein blaR1
MLLRRTLLLLAVTVALPIPSLAQTMEMPDWQKAAGGKMEFDVASVRLDTGDFKPPSIAMSSDDGMQPRDGLFHTDFPLDVDIEFAYKISLAPEQKQAMQASLPKWVKTDRYEIQARALGKPTKDQVRLMMQSLLEERFGLKVHVETRTVPVFALTLAKPGKLGPKLIPHSEGPPCPTSEPPGTPQPPQSSDAKPIFPGLCGVYSLRRNADETTEWGSRDTTLALVAGTLPSLGALGKPVVDQTGLSGNYDVSVEFSMEATRSAMRVASASAAPDAAAEPPPGITFIDAVREQLGLKLESTRAPVPMLVIEHMERPSEN